MREFPRGCEGVGTEVEILSDLPRLRINLAEQPLDRTSFPHILLSPSFANGSDIIREY